MNACFSTREDALRRAPMRKLAMVAVVGGCAWAVCATALADEMTTGRVFGNAPAGATVLVQSPEMGLQRTAEVDPSGRYRLAWLPVGNYTVTVLETGQSLVEHPGVPVLVDRGSRVDFHCEQGRCSEVAQR